MDPVKTVLVGYGQSGQYFHAPLLEYVDGLELSGVVSSKPELVNAALPKARVFTTLGEALDEPEVELIVLGLPNTLHHDYAKKALLAGKHVVVEKPFTITSDEARELIALADERDLKLSVYHNRRFDCDFLTLKDLIETGKLGDVHSYLCNYNRFRPAATGKWRETAAMGSGIFYDLGSHGIDQAIHLFGKPQTVQAKLRVQREGVEAVDHFHVVLGYEDKDIILHGNCLSTHPGPRYQVSGHKGTYLKYGMDPQEDHLKADGTPSDDIWGLEAMENWGVLYDETGQGQPVQSARGCYERYYEMMRDAVRGEGPVPVDPRDALLTIEIIEAGYKSNAEGRTIEL